MRVFLSKVFKGIGKAVSKIAPIAAPIAAFMPGVGPAVSAGLGALGGLGSGGGGGSSFSGLGNIATAGGALYNAQANKSAASAYANQAEKGITDVTNATQYGLDQLQGGTDRAAGELNNYFRGLGGQYAGEMGRYDPYASAGADAQNRLAALQGLHGADAQAKAFQGFTTSPGFAFRKAQGENAINTAAAQRGNFFTGDAVKALTDYNQNIASDEYGKYFQGLQSLAGTGLQATGAQTGLFTGLQDRLQQGATSRAGLFQGLGGQKADLAFRGAGLRVPLFTGMGEAYGGAKIGAANSVYGGVGDILQNQKLSELAKSFGQFGQAASGLFKGLGKSTPSFAGSSKATWGAMY